MIKKSLISGILFLLTASQSFADADLTLAQQINTLPSATSSSLQTDISQCFSSVTMNAEQLFYLSLSVLNKLNFQIKEVQSKTGTVIFSTAQKEFMLMIASNDSNSSFVKILPTDSNYSFSPAVLQNIFASLKTNSNVLPVSVL